MIEAFVVAGLWSVVGTGLICERRRRPPRANGGRIKLLEEWHRYYRMGCYSGGKCQHREDVERREKDLERKYEERYREFAKRARQSAVYATYMHDLVPERPRTPDPACRTVSWATDDNRFEHLKPWLDDVRAMVAVTKEEEL